LTSAKNFLGSPRALAYFHSLSVTRQKAIKKRLRDIDPEGCKRMKGLWISLKAKARHREKLANPALQTPDNESRQRDLSLVQTRLQEQGTPGEVRVISLAGFKHMLATCLAIYRPEEVAAFAGMELGELNSLVKPADLEEARKAVPEAIKVLADRVVLRDLSQGNVTQTTEIADRISARRVKIALDVHAEQRETTKDDELLQKQREKDIRERFRVDRGTGILIEGEAKEE